MGYICPACGEGLPEDEECPCQAIGDDLDGLAPGRGAKREQDRRRYRQMRTNGPVEAFTAAEIGTRDRWVCGICQDTERLVDPRPSAPRALSPSIDHIIPLSAGGPHTRANTRITHLWCNVERNSGDSRSPEYMRADLSRLLDGTPIPEEIYRRRFPSWRWPASPRHEYMIALYIAAGRVAAEPRYGDHAARLADAARKFGSDPEDAIRRGLEWMAEVGRRRAPIEARWRASR